MLRKLLVCLVIAGSSLIAANAQAAFHLWKISEIYSNADGTIQFIELFTQSGSQQFLNGQTISSTSGAITNTFMFPGNLPGDSTGRRFLIGTQGYAALQGVPAPDYVVPNGFIFVPNGTINFSGPDAVTYSGLLPTDGSLSLNRGPSPTFTITSATNSPTNFAGQTGTVVLPPAPTVPGAPVIGTGTPGDGAATIGFTAPASDGGSPITSYTAGCTPGVASVTGAGSPLTVMGLGNGTLYSCSVRATNSVGTGPASAPVNVTPMAPVVAPGAPTVTGVTPGNGSAAVAFNPPASDGGAAIINYIATCGAGVASGPSSPIVVTGLANGIIVACVVKAVNAIGTGPNSAAVNVTPRTIPDAPVISSAIAGDGQVFVAFTPPAFNGGAPIVSYKATCNGPTMVAVSGTASPIAVAPLTNDMGYTCSVTATNAAGEGTASATVNVTPSAGTALALVATVSRKTHGSLMPPFELPIDTSKTINQSVTIEPRTSVGGHTIVFKFNLPITFEGIAAMIDPLGNNVGSVSAAPSGNNVVVTLTGIAENARVTVSLTGVNMTMFNAAASIGFLVGDVNGSRAINASDISGVKARSNLTVDGGNYLFDINTSGTLNAQDVSAVKARSGTVLQ